MLSGIRVLDFTTLLPGPYASLRLSELGATVIQVEPPAGDPARHIGPKRAGEGVVFAANHRGKQSVRLNLKSSEDCARALVLAAEADVVLEGFRPGVAEALGIGYDAVRSRNPGVIYCSLTGYGQYGPWSARAGHDINFLAASGVQSLLVDEAGRPVMPRLQLADLLGGIAAAEAILAALVQRARTGRGGRIDLSMTDVLMGLLPTHAALPDDPEGTLGIPELSGRYVCYHIYRTADDRFVSLGALETKFWARFCRALGREAWVDAQFSHAVDENPVYKELCRLFEGRLLAEWKAFSLEVDCCLQPVLSPREAFCSAHAKARRLVAEESGSAGAGLRVFTSAGGHGAYACHR